MLGVALRCDDKVWRGIQRGPLRQVIDRTRAVDAAPVPRPCQLAGSLAAGVILVEARIVAVGEARETVLLVPAHLPGAAFLEKVVDGRIACQIVEKII